DAAREMAPRDTALHHPVIALHRRVLRVPLDDHRCARDRSVSRGCLQLPRWRGALGRASHGLRGPHGRRVPALLDALVIGPSALNTRLPRGRERMRADSALPRVSSAYRILLPPLYIVPEPEGVPVLRRSAFL